MSSRGSQSKSKARSKSSASKARSAPAPAKSARPARSPLLSSVQRKIAVGQKDDAYEREADAIADRVVNEQPSPSISKIPSSGLPQAAQRAEAKEEDKKEDQKEDEKKAQKKEDDKKPEGTEEEKKDEKAAQKMAIQRQASADEEAMEEGMEGEEPKEEDAAQAMPLQRASKSMAEDEENKEKQPAQKKADDKKPENEKDEKTAQKMAIQRKATADDAEAEAAERAIQSKGQGEPLHPSVQRQVERSTGASMQDVRVHRGIAAEKAAESLGARAFTHGRDIWLGKGQSPRDARLMAHEAAHVVQQTGRQQSSAVQSQAVQKSGGGASPTLLESPGAGTIDLAAKKITMDMITLPSDVNKSDVPTPITVTQADDNQRENWKQQLVMNTGSLQQVLPPEKGLLPPNGTAESPRVYYLKIGSQRSFIVGPHETVAERAKIPNWDDSGNVMPFEVDHKHEKQLGGPVGTITNYQLVDRFTNKSSGVRIRNEIRQRVKNVTAPHVGKPEDGKPWQKQPSLESLESEYTLTFLNKEGGLAINGPKKLWTKSDIENAKHIEKLKVLTNLQEIKAAGFPEGSATKLVLFTSESAGKPKEIPWQGNATQSVGANVLGIQGFSTSSITYTPGQGGSITGSILKGNKIVSSAELPALRINEIPGLPYNAYIDGSSLKSQMRDLAKAGQLSVKGTSPLEVVDASLEDKVMIRGLVKPSPKIFKRDVSFDITVEGNDVNVSKTFTAGEFELPGPVKITEAGLTLSVSTAGLKIDGDINFEVQRVGKGKISGKGSIANGFAVEGEFEFDKELFNEAEAKIKARYADDKFSGEGTIKIGEGKVKGIKSASAEVKVDGEKWEATGTVEPKVPGVESGTLGVKFDPDKGLEITGRLEFSKDIPRLKSGHIEAIVTKTEEGYQVEGSGSAELDIPGVTAGITAEYKNGIFKAEGTLAYKKDFASGEITAGVTNMAIGEDGQPTGDPGEVVRPYGKGAVSLQFTPWLKGTAGIKLDPSGKMEVTGRVEVPNKIEVFPEKKLEKELLSVGVDIPIVGVSVAGQRVGIFLNISGSLTAKASIGPGTLENVGVDATFDPDDLSTAKITGTASFVVPAQAGLRLAISGAIGAGIPIVSAKAGLEIGGELGVKGEARADAKVEWTPQTGVNMEADLSIQAQPVFLLDITGFVDVSADLVLKTIELYHKDWQLASFEFGSGMTLGAKVKLKVENNEFKVPSFEDIEFIKPDIDLMEVAGNIIDQIK